MQLKNITTLPPKDMEKDFIKEDTEILLEKIREYQRIMYAQKKYSMLIIFQAMDAAGKDGAVKDIFSGINPLWCRVFWRKAPTEIELEHDFLRRIHKSTPEKWMIHIFNRSHYEDILVPHVEWLLSKEIIEKRFTHVNNFEELLADNNTHVLKFYLHISREEQKERLEERLENPQKFRKHNDNDRESRKKRDEYTETYEQIFNNCTVTPRHVIPADKNRWKVHQIAQIIVSEFEKMDLQRPWLETEKFD
jgi:PPK2 family polyphosphate:nucleotide phosphotransferase